MSHHILSVIGNHSFTECSGHRVRIVLDLTSLSRVLLHFLCILAEKSKPTVDDRKKKVGMRRTKMWTLGINSVFEFLFLNQSIIKDYCE